MKTVLVALCIGIIGLGALPALAQDELPLATGTWPPYTSEDIEGYGLCTEIVSAIVREMGLTPKYTFFPWPRAELTIKQGEMFGTFPYAITPERQKEFDFSEMLLRTKPLFFYNKQVLKQPPAWTTLEDLRAYRIGGLRGSNYESAFKKAGLTVQYVNSEEANVTLLYTNRVDLVLLDEALGRYLIKKLYPDKQDIFGTLEKPYEPGNSYLMISRAYPGSGQLLDRFNQALQRIKEKGVYQGILVKYGIHEP